MSLRMSNVDALGMFRDSTRNWEVDEEWSHVAYNYVVLGFSPGSFFTAFFANDLVGAACHSHPSNTMGAVIALGKWLANDAPKDCWGSYEKVGAWLALRQEIRDEICEKCGLKATAWDILSRKEVILNEISA
jgi:hypothetical protein